MCKRMQVGIWEMPKVGLIEHTKLSQLKAKCVDTVRSGTDSTQLLMALSAKSCVTFFWWSTTNKAVLGLISIPPYSGSASRMTYTLR